MEIFALILEFIVEVIINPITFYIIGIFLLVTGITLAANHSEFNFLLSATGLVILGLAILFFKIKKDISEVKKAAKK